MTEIKIADQQGEAPARALTTQNSTITLYYMPLDIFLLKEPSQDRLIFAFKSSALAEVVERFPELSIVDVKLLQTSPLYNAARHFEKELYLILDSQDQILLTAPDHIFMCRKMANLRMYPDVDEYPVCEMYGIKENAPLERMLIGKRLMRYLDSAATAGQHKHLLYVLWQDLEQELRRRKRPAAYGDEIIVHAEFANCTARICINCKVVFDLL